MTIPDSVLDAHDKLQWRILQEATSGAKHMQPINGTALIRANAKKRRFQAQPDAEGDHARAMALMTIEERLRTLQRMTPQVESDDGVRAAFLRMCKDQQETYRLLAEEMVRLAPE